MSAPDSPVGQPVTALILFAHGSRDPRWALPFERMAQALRERLPSAESTRVQLAFLELMTPSLSEAATHAVQSGAQRIAVAPLFLGAGSHIREDLPALLDDLRQQHPGVQLDLLPLLGDMPELTAAVAGIYAPLLGEGTDGEDGQKR
ncbi:sirohydrochlorin chelatase [Amphibiibacter pelophylacis]|uniref:CbiX/SirB N-terminal domain-containing protein n=1 Tax=Amphibiibacter pelophylacis TaxID=1799477 RepID=A0ACC6P1M0_9BURK